LNPQPGQWARLNHLTFLSLIPNLPIPSALQRSIKHGVHV
jgi:hypothetical protein